MKNLTPHFSILLCTILLSCGTSDPEVPKIEATEKDAVEQFLEIETNVNPTGDATIDSLMNDWKIKRAESANSSPHKEKTCSEILTWLETTVTNYVNTGDTIALNAFINIENDVIFTSCLNSDNPEYRKKYDQILELLPD